MPKSTFWNLPKSKRDGIIDAATGEFAAAPYQDVSIARLIKAMDIPTGSFYQYFADKKDLYFYVLSLYVASLLDEANETGTRLNLFDREQNAKGSKLFTQTSAKPYYKEVFVKNYNLAPHAVKRDWTFDMMIGQKYMDIYDYALFEAPIVQPKLYQNKEVLMGLAMVIPNVVSKFVDRAQDPEKYSELYDLCIQTLKHGILHEK